MENDKRFIHESVLRDIFDLVVAAKDGFSNNSNPQVGYMRNIAKKSKELTLEFPVITSSLIDIDTAVMVNKAIERKCVTMMQMLFSAMNITNSTDAISYLRQFHTNIDMGGNIGYDDLQGLASAVKENFDNTRRYYLPGVSKTKPLHEYMVDVNNTYGHNTNQFTVFAEADDDEDDDDEVHSIEDTNTDDNTRHISAVQHHDNRDKIDNANLGKSHTSINKGRFEYLTKNELDTEARKANSITPSLLVINFSTVSSAGKFEPIKNYAVIGIKAMLTYVTSEDMLDHIIDTSSRSNGLFNFIKATTGQISFWKDFVFCINKAKKEAGITSKLKHSPLWKILENRAIRSKYNRYTSSNNSGGTGIATLVISKYEVDDLKKEYAIDLTRPKNVFNIINKYGLLCVAIVDTVTEKVSFLFDDGSDHFEVASFNSLTKDEAGGTYKKVINLLAKKG